jgi:pyruvate dehydrogenase E2 component (dihydrolipoamide acetyltransferase)
MGEFLMPSLGAEMEAGRLLSWYVTPGQQLRRGDIIAMIETDKANIDIEVFEDGIVEELLVEEGTRVPVGTPLARLGEPGREGEAATAAPASATPTVAEPATPTPQPAAPTTPEPAPPAPTSPPTADEPAPPTTGPSTPKPPTTEPPGPPAPPQTPAPAYTPVLRRLARERGVDLDTVTGTGPGGRVTRADVERAADTPTPPGRERQAAGHRASPYARRLAAEQGRDIATASGSGPGGAVVARDLGVVAPTPPPPAAPEHTAGPAVEPDRQQAMRQAIGRAMARSKREIPHYYLGEHVDVEQTMTWLEARNADRPAAQRLLPAVLVLKAVALACAEHPDLNGFWEDDAFRPGDGIHLGVAISLRRGGLIAPAIRDADGRSLDELMGALRDLVKRARSGGLRASELHDPTLTVTNLGDTGVETVYGVIQPPQVALVGAGAIVERPWADNGMVGARRCLHLTLSADHRASDGHRGALFLAAIAARLREPEKL